MLIVPRAADTHPGFPEHHCCCCSCPVPLPEQQQSVAAEMPPWMWDPARTGNYSKGPWRDIRMYIWFKQGWMAKANKALPSPCSLQSLLDTTKNTARVYESWSSWEDPSPAALRVQHSPGASVTSGKWPQLHGLQTPLPFPRQLEETPVP